MPTRRTVLAGLIGTAVAPVLARPGFAAPATSLYLSARGDRDGGFFASGFHADGRIAFDIPVPTRGHFFAPRPGGAEAVLFGRRPGDWALVADLARGTQTRRIDAAAGRWFDGHGIFAADGALLYATETIAESGDGIVGVYDARNGYRRVGEFSSFGLDPHDIRLMPDRRALVVANGGLLTHPDAPRMKLNVATMSPSLDYVDRRDGRSLQSVRLPQALHQLGIRHLAVAADGTVAIAMQYEGPSGDKVPLIGLHKRGEAAMRLLDLPAETLRDLRHYCGSAAMDPSGTVLGVSSPRGGRIVYWDVNAGRYLGETPLPDGCGLAACGRNGEFIATSGFGDIVRCGPTDAPVGVVAGADSPARWDNHVTVTEMAL